LIIIYKLKRVLFFFCLLIYLLGFLYASFISLWMREREKKAILRILCNGKKKKNCVEWVWKLVIPIWKLNDTQFNQSFRKHKTSGSLSWCLYITCWAHLLLILVFLTEKKKKENE
jgi:hypothetical protein